MKTEAPDTESFAAVAWRPGRSQAIEADLDSLAAARPGKNARRLRRGNFARIKPENSQKQVRRRAARVIIFDFINTGNKAVPSHPHVSS